MNTLQKFAAKQRAARQEATNIPDFSPGDTVKVNVKVIEGTRERIQAYEGICVAKSGTDISASFTVRKISLGEGVERVFPLYSPRIASIEVVRHGSVRRAKLYYLRDRRGKSARISERTTGHDMETVDEETIVAAKQEKQAAKDAKKEAKKAKKAATGGKKPSKAERKAAKNKENLAKKAAKAKEAEDSAAEEAKAEE